MPPIRVLIVDDSLWFRQAAVAALELEPDFVVVGCAASGAEAVELVEARRPDVVLLDVIMPYMNGWEVARCLKQRPLAPRVLIMSLQNGPEYQVAAAGVQADGFLCKTDFGSGLVPLLREWFCRAAEAQRLWSGRTAGWSVGLAG